MTVRTASAVLRPVAVLVLLMSCKHTAPQVAPVEAPAAAIEAARARVVPERVRARFGIKLRSPTNGIAGSTGGAMIVERPGNGRFDILTPLGGSALTLASTGGSALVLISREKTAYRSPDADAVLREATAGVMGLDDLWALFTGDLPFDDVPARSVKALDDGTVRAQLRGGKGGVVDLIVDPSNATPRQVDLRLASGEQALAVGYDGWTALGDGTLLPDHVTVYVPKVDLTVELKFRQWTVLDAAPDGAFTPPVPDGFAEAPMEDVFGGLVGGVPLEQ